MQTNLGEARVFEVTREPVRTRAVDTIVQKTVQRLPAAEQARNSRKNV